MCLSMCVCVCLNMCVNFSSFPIFPWISIVLGRDEFLFWVFLSIRTVDSSTQSCDFVVLLDFFYCVGDRRKCDSIVPLVVAGDAADDDGDMRGFFGEIFFWAGCKRLRSFRKSAKWKTNGERNENKLVKFDFFLCVNVNL